MSVRPPGSHPGSFRWNTTPPPTLFVPQSPLGLRWATSTRLDNYATYASRLRWPDAEAFCRKKHGIDLDTAYKRCFGWPLARADKIEHRLLILAESYDPRVTDAALYLINNGTPLALLQFTYFEIVDSRLFEVRTVLGEMPEQRGAPADTETPDQGRINWLLSSVAAQLPEIARRHGWSLRHFVRKQSLPFVSEHWPTTLDQCQLVLGAWSREELSLRLKFRHDGLPGMRELIEDRRQDWREGFPAIFANPPYPSVYTNLACEVPMLKMGDTSALTELVEQTERMAEVMVPLVDEYFEGRHTPDT